MSEQKKHVLGRREFLAAAAAATITIVKPSAVYTAEANSKVQVGLIGCGGRGGWLGNLFHQNAPAQVVAVADYFKDRADTAGANLGVDPAHRYTGLDSYKALLGDKVDAVAIISPPYFHPEQAVAAIEAGKHVYLAKPIAVDVPGALAIVNAANKVKDKFSVLVDFQTRTDQYYMEAIRRIHEGLIGEAVSGQVFYIAGRLGAQATPGTETARLRNWVFDKALSGDIIVEQNVHVLDVANWVLKGHPVKAHGTGGRKARVDVGDCWDHFLVQYWYPNDVLMDFSSAQYTTGFDDLCCRVFGTTGTFESHYGGQVFVRAKRGPYKGGDTRSIYQDGAVANIKNFVAAIQGGKPVNNAEESANSTMTAILGRMAAYEGRTVTWDEMIKGNQKVDAKLNLPADGPTSRG